VDYLAYARARDQVDPDSLTYSNKNTPGTFENHMRHKPPAGHTPEELDEAEGCMFEADRGVGLMLKITKLQPEPLKVRAHYPVAKFH
jgi:hypothetical protein